MAFRDALDEKIKVALDTMKGSPERVDLRVIRIREDRVPKQKIVRVKSDDGFSTTTSTEAALDDGGNVIYDVIEVVEYEITRDGTKCGGEARLDQIMSVDLSRPSDDYASNVARARATAIFEQLDYLRNGNSSPLPDGHMPIEDWREIQPHVLQVLKTYGIRSVQEVRDLTEAAVNRMPGGIHANRVRELARNYLLREQDSLAHKAKQGVSDAMKRMEDELTATKRDNEEMRTMMAKLLDRMDAMMATPTAADAEHVSAGPAVEPESDPESDPDQGLEPATSDPEASDFRHSGSKKKHR